MLPHKTQGTAPTRYNGIQVQSSIAGAAIPRGWGTFRCGCNLLWYGGFTSRAQKSSGGKGGGGSQTTGYSYNASVIMGICAQQIAAIRTVFKDQTATTLAGAGLALFNGALGQAPWPYVSTNFPDQALGYSGIAYVAAANYALTDSATLPNHSFEVVSSTTVPGFDDANPADVTAQFLAEVPYWVSGWTGDLSDYGKYCLASGLLISPVLDSQRRASEFLSEIFEATNSDAVWSEGKLKVVPYGDSSVTGNGVTWAPNLTPVFALDNSVLTPPSEGADPVQIAISRDDDAWNYIQVEYLDRAQQYNSQVVPGSDPASIDQWGKRPNSTPYSWHCICDHGVASIAAQLKVQRTANVRRKFTFWLPMNYALLDPMDLVTLTSGPLQNVLVRIKEISEAEGTNLLQFIAEEMLVGAGTPPAITRQAPAGYQSNFEVAPGDVNAPVMVSPPLQLTGGEYQLWIGASGGPNWGGAEVFASWDNATFSPVGVITAPARYGVTTAAVAAGSDPDTTNAIRVDMSESGAALTGTSQANADNHTTLALVGNEVISYSTATLTGPNAYTLSNYIRRGLMGSAIAAHAAGVQFVRLDETLFSFAYRGDQIGKTVYLKFRSFNTFGQAHQDLAAISTYVVTLSPSDASFTSFLADTGAYNADTTYRAGDVAQFQGNWYKFSGAAPAKGHAPPDPAYWVLLSANSWATIADNDPTRPKPQDGATVGAPSGTNVAGVPSQDIANAVKDPSGAVVPARDQIAAARAALEQSISQAQRDIATAQALISSINSSVSCLVTTSIPDLTQRITAAEGVNTSQGQLLTTYGTQISNVTSQASTTAGNLATLTQTVQAVQVTVSQQTTAISTTTDRVAQLSNTVSTNSSSISSLQTATTNLQGDMATVQTRLVAGSPNLLGNGGFEDGMRAWVSEIGNFVATSGATWGSYAYWDRAAALTTGERAVVIYHAPVLFDPGLPFTFTVDADCNNPQGNGYCRLEVHFYADQAMTQEIGGPGFGGTAVYAPWFGGTPGQVRKALAVSGVSPSYSQAMWVKCRVIFGNMTAGTGGAAVRQAKFERSPVPTAYSGETSLLQTYQSISSINGTTSSLQTQINTQGSSISSLQSSTSTLQGSVASITQRLIAGSPNLVPNGSGEAGYTQGWHDVVGTWGAAPASNPWGAQFYWSGNGATPDGERLVILDSGLIVMEAGATLTLTGDPNVWNVSNNAYCRFELIFYSASDQTTELGHVWGPNVTQPSWWATPGTNRQNMALYATAPAGTAWCRVRFVACNMSNTLGQSGAGVRQIKLERGSTITPYSSEASIYQSYQALSTVSQQYASLSSTVSTQGVTISSQQTAITTLNNNVATVFGQWVLDIDANGRVAGIRLANNGSTSSLRFRADLITFETPSGAYRTEYSNGGWRTYNASNVIVYEDGVYS